MKNTLVMFIVIALFASVFSLNKVSAQTDKAQKYEVKIKTSAYSEMCKNRIETEVKECKGVLDAYLSLDDQVITITYDHSNVKSSKLKGLINDIGYDAEVIEDKDVSSLPNGSTSKSQLNF